MAVELKEFTGGISEALPLYTDAGWTNYTGRSGMLACALQNSLKIIAAWDEEKLVGLIRAVGDGYSIVYIQDILVLEAYRRRGIGRLMMQRMMEAYPRVYQMVLLTDERPATEAFYKALGFQKVQSIGCAAFMRHAGPEGQVDAGETKR